MDHFPAVKNVEEELMKKRNHRRKSGDIPYPLDYSKDMLNFDNWDHMFLVSCCRSLTMHQFDSPPSNVLDLGCGGGFWVVEAAKQWKNSTITGFDLKAIQPNLSRLKMTSDPHLCGRVTWTHGNLLDKLPFPNECFDFVHIAGIGLGVPEDEWQNVLEEVSRIMKPGGVLEIIEENLLFPGIEPTSRTDSLLTVPLLTVRPPTPPYVNQIPRSRPISVLDVHDHGKLKASWEAMLTHRFLAPQLVAVLPFYLSSVFVDVRTHDTLHIPLPPNSPSQGSANQQDSLEPSSIFHMRSSSSTGFGNDLASTSGATVRTIPLWAPMHLAKAVRTVAACKESIWVEYQKLFGHDSSVPPVMQTLDQGGQRGEIPQEPFAREDFETEWSHWERDMADRINMRGFLTSECKWDEPFGPPPDWRIWRNTFSGTGGKGLSFTSAPVNLCRSLQGFVCWKPS